MGEYMVSRLEEAHNGRAGEYSIEGYDKALLLQQSKLEERLFLPAGTRYLDAIQARLTLHGITQVLLDQSDDTLQTDREDWEIGTSELAVINDLLKEINYQSLWFGASGAAMLRRKVNPGAGAINHEYMAGEYSIISREYSKALDIYDAPNVFAAMVSSPDYPEPLIATAVNDYPTSILSTVSRGRRIQAPIEKLKNIASQEALQEYVDNLRNESMLSTETVTFSTAKHPGHGVGDIVALDNGELIGIYVETGWSMSLAAGAQMQHNARRVVYL